MGYAKYAWVGNKISEDDMAQLYHLKVKTKKRINEMVAEAVKMYLSHRVSTQNLHKQSNN